MVSRIRISGKIRLSVPSQEIPNVGIATRIPCCFGSFQHFFWFPNPLKWEQGLEHVAVMREGRELFQLLVHSTSNRKTVFPWSAVVL